MILLGFRIGRSEPDAPAPATLDPYARRYARAQENIETYRGGIILCEVIGGISGTIALLQGNTGLGFNSLLFFVFAWYCARRRNWWTQESMLIREDAQAWEAARLQQEETP